MKIGDPVGSRVQTFADITRYCRCEDPRDRIFALKCLLPKRQADIIRPDYTKEMYETYRDFMVSCVIDLGNFDILCLRNLSNEPGRLLTWVVDWVKIEREQRHPDNESSRQWRIFL